ncbi:hypothetical protein [Microvirga ossetica]|nr:hypothetical protein [Microvirga ossetica]
MLTLFFTAPLVLIEIALLSAIAERHGIIPALFVCVAWFVAKDVLHSVLFGAVMRKLMPVPKEVAYLYANPAIR